MTTEVMKIESLPETCCICGASSDDLASLDEHDAALQLKENPLKTQFLALSQNKSLPAGAICGECVNRAGAAFDFQQRLRTVRPPPTLSDKIRALRQRLHDLTQKIDVFIVVGESAGTGDTPQYSEEDIIMVDRAALAAAAAADARDLELAANTRGDHVYQCSVCPQSFQKVSEFEEHASSHPADALHSCWTCGAQFAHRAAQQQHLRAHAERHDTATCHLCDTDFQSVVELRRHEGSCGWACPAAGCGRVCDAREELVAHAADAHGRVAPPPHVCTVCFARLPAPAALSAHMLQHRQARHYVCGYLGCILRFATRNNLMSHIRKCHGGAEPVEEPAPAQPTCQHCGRTFGSMAAMKRHARVHSAGGYRGTGSATRQEAAAEELLELDGEPLEVEYLDVDELEELQGDVKPGLAC